MPLTNDGAVAIASVLLNDGVVPVFDAANAAIGVGDDNTAFDAAQSQLQAEANGSNASRQGMNSGYPKRDPEGNGSNNLTRYQCTFGTSQGNFSWNEWGIFNDASAGAGTMLLRVVEDLGSKTNKTSWIFELDITTIA